MRVNDAYLRLSQLIGFNWRAGASQPSRTTGAIFLYIWPAIVFHDFPILRRAFCRKSLQFHVPRVSRMRKYYAFCAHGLLAALRVLALPGLYSRSPYYSWQLCVLLVCSRSPIMHCIHLLVYLLRWYQATCVSDIHTCSPASKGTHVGYTTESPDFRVLSR